MPDLLSLLTVGSSAMIAQNTSIALATNNVANVNTEGYSRERTDSSGNAERISSDLLNRQVATAAGSLAMSQAFADALAELEAGVSAGGATIDEQIGTLFSKIGAASAAPTDSASRDAVMAAARALVSGIQRRSADVAQARKDADARIREHVVNATSLAKQLATANTAVAKSGRPPSPASLDHRDQVAKQLGQVVGGQARIDHDGQMRFVLEGGAVLVDGNRSAALAATPDAATGMARIEVVDGAVRRDVTSAIGGGSMGGELKFRDRTVPQVSGQLDQVAFDITTSVNNVHTANAGLDGVTGRPLFVPQTQVAGAASTIAIDPVINGDSRLLALAAPGAGPGDNTGALALFGLGTQRVASGGTRTLGDAALDVVSTVALAGSDAKGEATRDALVSDHLAGLRDSLSGVDTQEELTNLARFEHASTAMAKFVTTIDGMLGSLIDSL